MYKPLVPCAGCSRHVLATESSCPFCHAALGPMTVSAPAVPRGLSRAAALALGATLVVACAGGTGPAPGSDGGSSGSSGSSSGSSGSSGTSGGPSDDGGPMALYGAPATDSGPDDAGTPGAKYGAPPVDAG